MVELFVGHVITQLNMEDQKNNYKEVARQARLKALELIFKAQTSHAGSNLSAIDIMTVLFDKTDLTKDEVVLSAGWKAAAWYYFLHKKGIISQEELNSFCKVGSKFIGLVEPVEGRWGLKFAGGSMGMGLAAGAGFALAKKFKNESGKVYVLESDGGLNVGMVWETALIAAQNKLDNLVLIVDLNGFQAMGESESVLGLEPLRDKFTAFNWDVVVVDGHDFPQMEMALGAENDRPLVIIANTTKGKGVSFFENDNLWHYAQIKEDDYKKAMEELNA